MDDWKRRLINEEKELKYKIDKLYRFLRAADRGGEDRWALRNSAAAASGL